MYLPGKTIAKLQQKNRGSMQVKSNISANEWAMVQQLLLQQRDRLAAQEQLLVEKAALATAQEKLLAEKTSLATALAEEVKILTLKLKLALAAKYARSTERYVDPRQGSLFDEPEAVPAEEEPAEQTETKAPSRSNKKKTGRKPLPEYLPRVRKEYTMPESELKTEDGFMFVKIGEVITEELVFIPSRLEVIEHVRFKYACKEREEYGVKIAPMGERAIPQGIASPSLLAHVLVQKYCYHLPLYRQEQKWRELDIELNRNILCNWVMQCSKLLEPIYEALKDEILGSNYIHADETPVTVLTHGENDKNRRRSYMWVYGNSLERLVFYDYQETRAGEHVFSMLQNCSGHIQADAYSGYDQVYRDGNRTEVGCWAHARRKFHDIIKAEAKHQHAGYALQQIKKLYEVEAAIEKYREKHPLTDEQVKQWRKEYARPILAGLKAWMESILPTTPPKGLLRKAISYGLNHWQALTEYTRHGHLKIDNNFAENAIRPFALGRKNWLFHGNHKGARASAIIYSILESAKAHGLKPHEYMTHLLDNIKSAKTAGAITGLLPHKIAATHPALLSLKSRAQQSEEPINLAADARAA